MLYAVIRREVFYSPLVLWVILNLCFLMFGLYWYYPRGYGPYSYDIFLLGEHMDIWSLPRYDLSVVPALLILGSNFLTVLTRLFTSHVMPPTNASGIERRSRSQSHSSFILPALVFIVLMLSLNTVLPALVTPTSTVWLPSQVQSENIASQQGIREASLFIAENAPASSAVLCGPEVGWPLVWYSRHRFAVYLEIFDPFQDAKDTLIRGICFASEHCTDIFLIFREYGGFEEVWPWVTRSSDHRYHESFMRLYPLLQPIKTIRLNEYRSILIYHLPLTG
jgi:hypothetical protein